MKKTLAFAAAGMALFLGSTGWADDAAGHHAPPTFEEIDADGDEMITKEELTVYMEQRRAEHERREREHARRFNPFDHADADQDGILNRAEFDEMMLHIHRRVTREHRSAPSTG